MLSPQTVYVVEMPKIGDAGIDLELKFPATEVLKPHFMQIRKTKNDDGSPFLKFVALSGPEKGRAVTKLDLRAKELQNERTTQLVLNDLRMAATSVKDFYATSKEVLEYAAKDTRGDVEEYLTWLARCKDVKDEQLQRSITDIRRMINEALGIDQTAAPQGQGGEKLQGGKIEGTGSTPRD